MPEPTFLLDANMPRSAATPFEDLGYDVHDVRDIGLGGATDREIVVHAQETGRIIVTRDTDFGSVLRYPDHPGAIILRLPSTFRSDEIVDRLRGFFGTIEEERLSDAIHVIELGRYRRRPIP